jgi:hypothetical protein
MSKAYTRIFDDGTFITKKMLVNDEIDAGCMKTDLHSLRIRNAINGGQNQILLDRENGISFLTKSVQSIDNRWQDVQILLGRNFENINYSAGEPGARMPFNRPGIQSIITDKYFGTGSPYEVTSRDKEYDKAYISTLYLDCKTYNKETNSSNGYVSYNDYAICSPHGTFAGLRPKIIYLTKGSYSLTELDHTIVLNNETKDAATTLTLPSSPIDGQEYFIYQIKRGGDFRIKTGSSSIGLFSMNGNALKTFKEGNTTVNGDTFSNDNNWFVNIIFCKAYGNWIMRYNSYS